MKESFIVRAEESLHAAEILFENGLFNSSANRSYYAAFQAAIAAIFHAGVEPAILHQTVQTLFSDLYINRRKVLSSKYKSYLYDMQTIRNLADYGHGVSKKKSKENLNNAKEFSASIFGVIL